jgi:hypothetical protein
MRNTLQEIRIGSTNKGKRAYLLGSGWISVFNEKELCNRDTGERNGIARMTRSALPATRTFANSVIASSVTLSLESGGHYIKSDELWNSI